jgi:hypothetical protein
MKDERKNTLQMGRKMGALAGGIMFAIFGIVPGFYFGSYGTLMMLSALAGGPIESGIIARAIIVVGTVLGIFCMAAVSIVTGAVAGTALAYVADIFKAKPEPEEAGATAKS